VEDCENASIVDKRSKVVLVHDDLWNVLEGDAHVLEEIHVSVEAESFCV
jgi:hypothetical protein